MTELKPIKLDEDLRRPGMQRVLDALKKVEEEAPRLIDKALIAAFARSKRQDGGQMAQ
jgi:hypothetical protein